MPKRSVSHRVLQLHYPAYGEVSLRRSVDCTWYVSSDGICQVPSRYHHGAWDLRLCLRMGRDASGLDLKIVRMKQEYVDRLSKVCYPRCLSATLYYSWLDPSSSPTEGPGHNVSLTVLTVLFGAATDFLPYLEDWRDPCLRAWPHDTRTFPAFSDGLKKTAFGLIRQVGQVPRSRGAGASPMFRVN